MIIRKATKQDAPAIRYLISQFGVQPKLALLEQQLGELANDPGHQVWVYENKSQVLGYIVFHFLPRPAFTGDTVFISDLVVDAETGITGISRLLEEYVSEIARARKCGDIQLHCQSMLTDRRRFYEKQGYTVHDKYYNKRLIYAE